MGISAIRCISARSNRSCLQITRLVNHYVPFRFSAPAYIVLLLENEQESLAHRPIILLSYLMPHINRICKIHDLVDNSLLWTFVLLYLDRPTTDIISSTTG